MIRYLAIRNLAVIDAVAIEFEPAFNVLTGETGAGKSMLVEAVGLLLGGRASPDLVRTGEDLATVEALFDVDGDEVLVRREITAQGRSRAFIAGALVTNAALRDLGARVVELHGQHEHQQLLDAEQHVGLLDSWAGLEPKRHDVSSQFRIVAARRQQLDQLRLDGRERAARLELVEFQLGELTKSLLVAGEDEQLETERQLLRSADTIRRLCDESYAQLYESDQAVLASLGQVWRQVTDLARIDPTFRPYLDQRESIKAQLEDLALTLRDFADRIDAAPGRLEQVEDRLALLERLKRKHGPTLTDVLARRELLAREREALTGGEASIGDVEQALRDASARYLALASELSAERHRAAPTFARALEGELSGLAMDRSAFEVRLVSKAEPAHWTERGIDSGEFYLSANLGEELRPLARIVSGGELSRVMLALKTLAAGERPGTALVFDEVDAGIGGRVASVVGEKLARLGGRSQVLCITHLPQIAACAATHFHLEKGVQGQRTVTTVSRLSEAERVSELARMIGGAGAGPRARATAEELLATHAYRESAGEAKGESAARRKRK
ncbi:MAG: DNA repair protein RecN [Acidobacteriota bacterium]